MEEVSTTAKERYGLIERRKVLISKELMCDIRQMYSLGVKLIYHMGKTISEISPYTDQQSA